VKVKDLMTPNPTVCRPEDTASQAATLMKQEDCGAIPVVADGGKLVGIVTDRDIVVRAVAAGKDPRSTAVSAVMSADPVTLSPDSDADEAEKLMAERQVRRLPVVENGRLVGIIVTAQLARRGNAKESAIRREVLHKSTSSTTFDRWSRGLLVTTICTGQ
jgi:CBS domain-containing protein